MKGFYFLAGWWLIVTRLKFIYLAGENTHGYPDSFATLINIVIITNLRQHDKSNDRTHMHIAKQKKRWNSGGARRAMR